MCIFLHIDYSISELEKCTNNLKHKYLKKINQRKTTKWPPKLGDPTLYVEVTIVKANFLPEKLHKEYAMGLVKTCYLSVTVERLLQDDHGKIILIEGDPGIGKTTVTFQICKKWAENKLLMEDVVFWIPLHHYKSVTTVCELFDKLGYPEMMAYAQQNNGKGLVLIFDGWDELPNNLQTASLFHDIIFGTITVFTQSTIIVTSRPTCCDEIAEEVEQTHSYYRILGFDQQKAIAYIKAYFHSDPSTGESLLKFLHSHEYLCQDFHIPISVAIMCFVYHSNDNKIPPTLSRLYEYFVVLCLRSNVPDTCAQDLEKFKTIHNVPEKVKPIFHKLCKLAFDMLEDSKLLLNKEDMPDDINNLQLKQFDGLGLLHVDHFVSTLATIETSYSFIHRVVQELLAAIFILNTGNISIVVDKYFYKGSCLMNVFPFLFGLARKEHLRPLAETLIHINNKSNRNDEVFSSILHCLFEAKDDVLCRQFAQGFNAKENVNLYIHTLLDCHYACYFIATCGIKGLNICMYRCNFIISTDLYCNTIAKYLQNTSTDISSFHVNIYGALSHKGIKEFAETLSTQPNILSLELIGSCVPGCLKILCYSICKYNPHMTNLRLPNGKLSENDLENIGFVLTTCNSLETLYVCCKPNEGVSLALSSFFYKALCATRSLTKLVLPWWTLTEAESEVFGNIIRQNCSLKELWINVANVNCLDPILNGLSSNASITTFRTWPDKTGTSNTLGQCFNNCLHHNRSLKVIDFNDALSMLRPPLYITWSSTQVNSVCAGLCANTTLATLDISGCYIDNEACRAVCGMFSQNATLQHLFLNPVHLEKQEAIAMIDGCKTNNTLKLLSLVQWPLKKLLLSQGNNPFQFYTDEDVGFAIQQMQKLRKQRNKPILHIYWSVLYRF